MSGQHPLSSAITDLPAALRILSLTRLPAQDGKILNHAVLYHGGQTWTVEWLSRRVDSRLRRGELAAVVMPVQENVPGTRLRVQRVRPALRVLGSLNLFETIPPTWMVSRIRLARAAAAWGRLPQGVAYLFNVMFWQGETLRRFLGLGDGPDPITQWIDTVNAATTVAHDLSRPGSGIAVPDETEIDVQ